MVVEIRIEKTVITRQFDNDATAIQFAAILLAKPTRVIAQSFYAHYVYIECNGCLNVRVAETPRWGL